MLISAADDIFACELGIFNLKIGKNLGVLALGMVPFTGTSYIRKKNTVIRRIFKHLDERTFITMYKTLVRTHLDYASSVWFPYRKRHIELTEGVQRRATKQIPGMKDLNYEERLRKLKLPTLKYRTVRLPFCCTPKTQHVNTYTVHQSLHYCGCR